MSKPKKTTSGTRSKKAARSAATVRVVKTNARTAAAYHGTVKEGSSAGKPPVGRHPRVVSDSQRLERLVDQLGNNRLAKLMSVSPSQPSRWRAGKEGIGPENQRRLIDLDYVFGRLEQLFTPRQAEIWLTSSNAHLGARPIDVLRLRGVAPVIAAIDAEAEGAFA